MGIHKRQILTWQLPAAGNVFIVVLYLRIMVALTVQICLFLAVFLSGTRNH